MAKISIITPTVRREGLELISRSLETQIFTDFEWLIGSPFDPEIKGAKWIKDDFKGGYWSLNRIYNRLFKEAKGELIVSWQDFIWATPHALSKFWHSYKQTASPVTGVGDQYAKLDEYGKPIIKVWSDPRKTDRYGENAFYRCNPEDWELNFCSIPRKLVFAIGGMDEELDFTGLGMDNVSIAERLDDAGCDFYIDQGNECFGLKHSRRKDWDKFHNMHSAYQKRKQELKEKGKWPKLDYL